MEESLVESSTYFRLAPSLASMARGLKKNASHHDHLIGIFVLLMGESGFRLDDSPDAGSRPTSEARSVSGDADDWRSSRSADGYELRFKCDGVGRLLDCKIVAFARGDVVVVNLCPTAENANVARTRSAAFQTLRYVNPHSSGLAGRFMNLRELSHRFKDSLATPLRGEILTSAGITNASLAGLPTELKLRIFAKLRYRDLHNASMTCREFRDLTRDDLRRLLKRTFTWRRQNDT